MTTNFDVDSEIVLSGISGRFPKSSNLDEFWKNLLNGVDMVGDAQERFNVEEFDLPTRMAVLSNLDKFDAEYFGIHTKQADSLDPRIKQILEVTYEAIVDAALAPMEIAGSNTGVFLAICDSASSAISMRSVPPEKHNMYGILGGASSMLANRISFSFDLHGPSYTVDTACSSSAVALHQALLSIQSGICDAAIVSSVQTHHDPIGTQAFYKLQMTSADGKCKVLDAAADGYVRAEAAVSIYICKKKVAKRAYATLCHAAINNDGYKEQGVTFPSQVYQEQVIRKVYSETGVDPLEVDYLEIHGTGTKVGDPQEMLSVSNVFCEGRDKSLPVGSYKSNMGHPEPVAGLCALAKLVMSHCNGTVPANLHFKTPNPDIPSLHDGRVQVITKNQPFSPKYVGVNSMGFGGTNVHILLKFEPKEDPQPWKPSSPLILICSGRTQEAVEVFLNRTLSLRENRNFVQLTHELSRHNISRHPFRGYVIVEGDKMELQVEQRDSGRDVWYIITGLGSQWEGMSRDLIKFATFSNSIKKSGQVLLNNNFDIMTLLESGDPKHFEDFKNSVVSITVIQIALIDLLKSVGISSNGIIGHSTGEVAAGYADDCLTQEQAVLTSYARVRSILDSNLVPGMVASVGLTWDEAKRRCPKGIYPAIHNGKDNVTIAGSPEDIQNFVMELEQEGIFVKLVRSASFGFHSPLVHESGKLGKILMEPIIPNPKLRSSKWLSSSVAEENWGSDLAKFCSADYYVNNGIHPVYFYPTLKYIPENSVVLEIGPHCFFQSILKKSLSKKSVVLGLIHVKSPDNCVYFLNTMGKCYIAGVGLNVARLYEPVSFPVAPGTPNISSMVGWDHSVSFSVPHHSKEITREKGIKITCNLSTERDAFLEGHVIDGKILYPATGYIYLVWKCFAKQNGSRLEKFPVVFEDIRFERATILNKRDETDFLVNIFSGSGKFEILESEMVVCTGFVRNIEESFEHETLRYGKSMALEGSCVEKEDFYREMSLRGYNYTGLFQGVEKAQLNGQCTEIKWQGEWISFFDTVLQSFLLLNEDRDLYVPLRIQKLTIDPTKVKNHLGLHEDLVEVAYWNKHRTGTCPGIEVRGLNSAKFNHKSRHVLQATTEQSFWPYLDDHLWEDPEVRALQAFAQIVAENSYTPKFLFTEILTSPLNMIGDDIAPEFSRQTQVSFRLVNKSNDLVDEERLNKANTKVCSIEDVQSGDFSHFVFFDVVPDTSEALKLLHPGGFILYKSDCTIVQDHPEALLICRKKFKREGQEVNYFLFRKNQCDEKVGQEIKYQVINIPNSDFSWVETAKGVIKNLQDLDRLYFIAEISTSGIAGFFKCLTREFTPEKLRCFHSFDKLTLDFVNPSENLKAQIQMDLAMNLYKDNVWGTLCNLSIPKSEFQKKRLTSFAYANAQTLGDLASLTWIESPLANISNDFIDVHYSALNFRDIMFATGRLVQQSSQEKIETDCVLGLEFSGIFQGKRVCGMGLSECLATRINADNKIFFEIPDNWSFEEAATVPCVYITVYLALIMKGKMKAGESILIHAGSGGVGQAAIQMALEMGCRVFTTVSTEEKREFLKLRFPALTDDCFANSREASDFESHIFEQTNGRGVDLVLNSLAQDKLFASIRCLAFNGRFLEIGKFDIFNDTKIGLSILSKGVTVSGIMADQMLSNASQGHELKDMCKFLQDNIPTGKIRPLTYQVFKHDQLEEAFRFMAKGKHIGKVLIQMKEDLNSPAVVPSSRRTYFNPHKSYIIIGGLGGMGFELACWMVKRGAKKLLLTSRSGIVSSYHRYHMGIWKGRGVVATVDTNDSSMKDGARALLGTANKLGPIGGIFNVALVLKDSLFVNQTKEDFEDVAKCKAEATLHLDLVSRDLAPELDYFVAFSSIVVAKGNPGQTNYGFANSVMERICEQRKSEGLPALAIQWGAVGDVGIFHRTMKDRNVGLAPQSIKSCLETLDVYLQQNWTVVSSFIPFMNIDAAKVDPNESLMSIVANILGIKDIKKIDPTTPLVDLGMDSLMAAELAQVLQSRISIQLSQKEYSQLTFEKLKDLEVNGSLSTKSSVPDQPKKLVLRNISDKPVNQMRSLQKSPEVMFVVHPIDGTVLMLEELVSELEATVYGVECSQEAPLDSIESLASFYIQKIREIQPDGPYKICGYSFGATVAFEMALQLEKVGQSISLLLLLDGSPRIKHFLDTLKNVEASRVEWENKLVFGYLTQALPNSVDSSHFVTIARLDSLDKKLNFAIQLAEETSQHSAAKDLKILTSNFAARMKCVMEYEVAGKLRGRAVLVKAVSTGDGREEVFNYGLGEVSEHPVEVVEVEGNHFCFYEKPMELGLPAILNRVINA